MIASVITLVNDIDLYNSCVVGSLNPNDFELIPLYNPSTASKYLNIGIEQASCDICILCHQDVIFTKDWGSILIQELEKLNNSFGVVGTYGKTKSGLGAGQIYNPKPRKLRHGVLPMEVMSLDEHCLILKKSNLLRFDDSFMGFHLYGADICLTSLELGFSNYAIHSNLEHLSGGNRNAEFSNGVVQFINKWHDKTKQTFFITTCCRIDFKTKTWKNY